MKSSDLKTTYNFVLTNQNASDAQVYYTIYRQWDEYNYIGIFTFVSGVALVHAGAATIDKVTFFVREYNKALENQD